MSLMLAVRISILEVMHLQYSKFTKGMQTKDFLAEGPENFQFHRGIPFSRPSSSSSSWVTMEFQNDAAENNETETTKDCTICGESRLDHHFVPATFNCQHNVDYCSECLRAWISSSLEGRGWDKIRCPATECGSTLKTEDIQAHADRETFER